jgi:hypothetical protein
MSHSNLRWWFAKGRARAAIVHDLLDREPKESILARFERASRVRPVLVASIHPPL